jgi:hypothetical protein
MAREVQALARARTVKTPAQRLRVVVWDCGVEQTWRAVAGTWPALYDPRTDQAVAERLRAGKPGGPALLRPMVPGGAALPQGWRVVVIDASRGPAPGARGTDDRLPRGLAVVSGECLEGSRTAAQTGETLQQVSWGPGDVAVAARGDAPPQGLGEAVSQGAALLVRLTPCRVGLCAPAGQPLGAVGSLEAPARRPHPHAAGGGPGGLRSGRRDGLGACRALAGGASPCRAAAMPAAPSERGAASGPPVSGGRGARADHAVARGVVRPDDPGGLPLSLASGPRHKTGETGARCGRVTGESAAPARRGLAAWHAARGVEACAAQAAPAGRPVESIGSRARGHVGARLGPAQRGDRPDDHRGIVREG